MLDISGPYGDAIMGYYEVLFLLQSPTKTNLEEQEQIKRTKKCSNPNERLNKVKETQA